MEKSERLSDLLEVRYKFGSLPLIDAAHGLLSNCSGIYFVIHPEHGIIYIGQAKSLKVRCRKRPWFAAAIHIVWVRVAAENLNELERYLIRLYRPSWNIAHNRPKKTKAA
jgi:excinuclease UvrABC nuclease subunit